MLEKKKKCAHTRDSNLNWNISMFCCIKFKWKLGNLVNLQEWNCGEGYNFQLHTIIQHDYCTIALFEYKIYDNWFDFCQWVVNWIDCKLTHTHTFF